MVDLKMKYPENFLQEEIRCGYTVSSKMKEIWAVELDLLVEFDRVCNIYNIKYWASGGTLLGAVRHQGFIPWDDDIDVVMLRADFERLCKVAPVEFINPYFWQTHDTDPNSYRGHAQLRNSSTTAILNSELKVKKKFNQGIFIDIFPLDKIPIDPQKQCEYLEELEALRSVYLRKEQFLYPFQFRFRKNLFILSYNMLIHYFNRCIKGEKYCKNLTDKSYQNYLAYHSKYKESEEYEYILSPLYYPKMRLLSTEICDIQRTSFEFIDIPIPIGYDSLLTRQYGDWHQYIKGGSYHKGVFFDTNTSYKKYLFSTHK